MKRRDISLPWIHNYQFTLTDNFNELSATKTGNAKKLPEIYHLKISSMRVGLPALSVTAIIKHLLRILFPQLRWPDVSRNSRLRAGNLCVLSIFATQLQRSHLKFYLQDGYEATISFIKSGKPLKTTRYYRPRCLFHLFEGSSPRCSFFSTSPPPLLLTLFLPA